MKAAVFYGTHDIRLEEMTLRKLDADEVLIKVRACGVCGTDIHVFEGAKGSAEVSPPIILGHEISGEIEQVGEHLKTGERVCIDPNMHCGRCYYCRKGEVHLCENLSAIGVTTHGGFAEYCIAPVKQVYPLPDHLSFEEGAMSEPVSCCLHGLDLANVTPGDTVLIIGAGTIGLIMLQLVQMAGAAKVIVSEPVEEKTNLASFFGADEIVDPQHQHLQEFIREHTHGGVDVAIECVGIKETMTQALLAPRRGGTAMLFGLAPPDCEIALKPFDVFQRELTIRSSFVNPFTQSRAVKLLGSRKIQVKKLITDKYSLDEIIQVFENDEYRKKGKVVITND